MQVCPSHNRRTPRGSTHRPIRQTGVNIPGPSSGEMGPFLWRYRYADPHKVRAAIRRAPCAMTGQIESKLSPITASIE